MTEQARRRHYGGWIVLICVLAAIIAALAIFNQVGYGNNLVVKIQDFYQGQTYQPSAEMARIKKDLQLTEKGEFLFNAARPELMSAADFNAHCRNGASETAVLGCYTGGNIYVYNITDSELNGIRELTSAHELLHAVYARMSDEERAGLVEPLTRTFDAHQDYLGEEINNYDSSQKQEELYVRAGTEVADLPEALERHYAQFFKDQDAIVAFYNSYINVFRALKSEMSTLKSEMEAINTDVTAKTAEYERRSAQLSADIVSFNSCAKVTGCFSTEDEFTIRREALLAEQAALEQLYNEINDLIAAYNAKVEIYNADVSHGEQLNNLINSAAEPQVVK